MSPIDLLKVGTNVPDPLSAVAALAADEKVRAAVPPKKRAIGYSASER